MELQVCFSCDTCNTFFKGIAKLHEHALSPMGTKCTQEGGFREEKSAWHVDMVNILWIKRKNHLHFAMQMVKSVEVAGFEPAAFWSRTKRATKLRYTSKSEPTEGLEPSTCGLRNRCSTD